MIKPVLSGLCVAMLAACDRGGGAANPPANAPAQTTETRSQPALDPLTEDQERITGDALVDIHGLIITGKTGPARIRLKRYLQSNPETHVTAFLWAHTYHREKKYDRAATSFRRAIELEPRYSYPYYYGAWASFYLGRMDEARALFTTHLRLRPGTADSHFGLGLIDLDAGLLDDAERRFQTAIELETSRPQPDQRDVAKAYVRLADVAIQRDDLQRARELLDTSIDAYDGHYETYLKLSQVLERLGESELAEEALQKHIEIKERVRPGTSFPDQ